MQASSPLRRWQAAPRKSPPPNFENDKVNPAAEGSRVIAVSFTSQPQTKTTLDGFQPKFQDKDSILISNGKALDTCSVSVDGDNATISTNLTGPLKAVYPYKAAKLDGKNPNQIDTVFVSPVQSGTFADANICMAVMKDKKDESLSFENKTAVLRFYVGSEIEVTSVTLESLSESFAPNIGTKITVEAPDGKTLYDQMPENQDRRVCYVAVPYGMHEQLTITTAAKNQTPEPKKLMKCSLAAGSMYTVFIPYYIEVDGQKWGYCNIGAFLPEESGEYFAWGGTKGYIRNNEAWESAKDATPLSGGFSQANAPHYESSVYTKYTSSDSRTVLESDDDAAYKELGGKWRMPTSQEFQDLADACGGSSSYDKDTYKSPNICGESTTFSKGIYWCDNYDGVAGCLFYDGTNKLFFPAAGGGDGTTLSSAGTTGYYWSSSLSTDSPNYAYALGFSSGNVSPQSNGSRYYGFSVRPVSD